MFGEIGTTVDHFFSEARVDIIVSFMAPIIMGLIAWGVRLIVRISTYKPYKKIIGKYYLYYSSTIGSGVGLVELDIKSFLGMVYVRAKNDSFKYKGKVIFDQNMYIELESTNFHDRLYFVFNNTPPFRSIKRLYGVFASSTAMHEPVNSKVILSSSEISYPEAVALLKSSRFYEKNGATVIRVTNDVFTDNDEPLSIKPDTN